MNILHQTRNILYRKPFGAVPTDEKVYIAVQIQEVSQVLDCYLNYSYGLQCFSEGKATMNLSNNPEKSTFFECSIKAPDEYGLLFYWFEIITENGIVYYGYNANKRDGSGLTSTTKPNILPTSPVEMRPFQITVYDRAFKTPDWFKGSVLYQIFPDRFARDQKFSFDIMKNIKNTPERIFHENWDEEVDYKGNKETGYLACDFFGGNIKGMTERLDYLKDLGVETIYCNPIFESRSNHRYDTGNYENVDPILGTNEDFVNFAKEAKNRSIKLILDGVFSHTGADSIYFNKLNRYDSPGAYQDAEGKVKSPYFSWYHFNLQHGYISYDSWWGFSDLPCVNENDLQYKEYIMSENGIARTWLKRGATGWRLDVSDEIPDGFLRELRKTIKRENVEAVILGEVWEDASNKISYGAYRDFLFGSTHDCVMGYPFRNAVIGWLSGKTSVMDMRNALESIRENYPLEAFYCNMNLISSHDVPRAITELAGEQWVQERVDQSNKRLNYEQRVFGEKLLKLAMLIQFTYPGTPSIYYGDEIALEGYRDPFNRRTFPWHVVDGNQIEIKQWLTALLAFRKQYQIFKTGLFEFVKTEEDVLVYRRYYLDGKDAFGTEQREEGVFLVIINKNPYAYKVSTDEFDGAIAPYSGVIVHNGSRVFEI